MVRISLNTLRELMTESYELGKDCVQPVKFAGWRERMIEEVKQ